MRIIFKATALVIALSVFVSTRSFAQFQLNVAGVRSIPIQRGMTLNDGTWGTGVTVRYFINPRVAVGVNARYFTQRSEFGAGTFRSNSRSLMTTGQVEYFFSTRRLRPYVGLEAGLYTSNNTTEFYDYGSTSPRETFSGTSRNVGLSPKAGLQWSITQSVGVNAELGYHYIFDGNDNHTATVSLGAFVKFGKR
ncbi:outer membrane beta-barrel protein [uncultured Spirosoma sp.]|uniref:outer membrane beta-barrel protein n=1 Tax=uncultured Spirosoma sp. TaxID=278208 RepID=UPI00258F39A7|nr:outer membrane beta-barrel protein [uncultured Spirosoma sp.]